VKAEATGGRAVWGDWGCPAAATTTGDGVRCTTGKRFTAAPGVTVEAPSSIMGSACVAAAKTPMCGRSGGAADGDGDGVVAAAAAAAAAAKAAGASRGFNIVARSVAAGALPYG
jgi:hypothetical protein